MFDKQMLNRLYRYACSLTGDEVSGYDLLHDSVERCLRKSPATMRCEEAYTRQVIRNRYIDQLRKQAKFPHDSLDEDESAISMSISSLEDIIITDDLLEQIWLELNFHEREILYLWAVEQKTAQQIAVETNSQRGTILSRIHRIRKKLNNRFNKQPDELLQGA